ncbi:MAG: alpha/beta fold hydrolase [Hyphomicrobiaceae bacterium]|nr:alpha/beta fold hydrolase [Hyphomicrobiaceae bacterium]
MSRPADAFADLERQAEIVCTPCGDGDLVWRRWGSGEPVVLCHGGSGSWTHWVRTIPALSRVCEVWAPDLPGLGDSAMPPRPWTPATSARIITEGLRALVSADRSLRLVGFSFGAHVATLAAADLGNRLSDLTIIGSAALGLPWRSLELPKERSSMTAAERRQVHRRTLEVLMFADPGRIDDDAVDLQVANVARARFRSREFAATDEIRTTLARVAAPLKAIWGERDAVAQPSVGACLDVLRLHHPELVARVIPGAGHWVMYEAAEAFNAALADVLDLPPGQVASSQPGAGSAG